MTSLIGYWPAKPGSIPSLIDVFLFQLYLLPRRFVDGDAVVQLRLARPWGGLAMIYGAWRLPADPRDRLFRPGLGARRERSLARSQQRDEQREHREIAGLLDAFRCLF